MKTIIFFNHWHNGDVFASKGYIKDALTQISDIRIAHAHINSTKLLQDLHLLHTSISILPPELPLQMKFFHDDATLLVNTWIGAFIDVSFVPGQVHADWPSLHKMWKLIYENINSVFNINLKIDDNILKYIPETDFRFYDVEQAYPWLSEHPGPLVLVCNGDVRSKQSEISGFNNIVNEIARQYPNITFICTQKMQTNANNISFTDDILKNVKDGDINEIAYLSTKCRLIVGRNSGPYMFTHIKENINDPSKTFLSLSHRISDSYAHGVEGLQCNYLHHCSDNPHLVLDSFKLAIENKSTNTGKLQQV